MAVVVLPTPPLALMMLQIMVTSFSEDTYQFTGKE